jgi:hypothetical protein
VRFRGRIVQQTFSGPAEHLELDCGGQLLRARIAARGVLEGDYEFFFEPGDAVAVRD